MDRFELIIPDEETHNIITCIHCRKTLINYKKQNKKEIRKQAKNIKKLKNKNK